MEIDVKNAKMFAYRARSELCRTARPRTFELAPLSSDPLALDAKPPATPLPAQFPFHPKPSPRAHRLAFIMPRRRANADDAARDRGIVTRAIVAAVVCLGAFLFIFLIGYANDLKDRVDRLSRHVHVHDDQIAKLANTTRALTEAVFVPKTPSAMSPTKSGFETDGPDRSVAADIIVTLIVTLWCLGCGWVYLWTSYKHASLELASAPEATASGTAPEKPAEHEDPIDPEVQKPRPKYMGPQRG